MRQVLIENEAAKVIDQKSGRAQLWYKSVIKELKDEKNSMDYIKEKFEPLKGNLKGCYKAKHRGLGIRLIFEIIDAESISIHGIAEGFDEDIEEAIKVLIAGNRDKIYGRAERKVDLVKKLETGERVLKKVRTFIDTVK